VRRTVISAAVLAAIAAGGCGGSEPGPAERGHDLIVHYGCGACHRIDGVRGADATVGPSLADFRGGRYIAGRLVRNHANTVRWILDPRAIEPDTIMPDLDLTREQAEAVATYLFSQ
jgi:cytochrome c551/c552